MPSEFDIIKKYFSSSLPSRDDVLVGIGDDAAVLEFGSQGSLIAACDTLLESVHFPVRSAGGAVARRALAVNLSDFAAMGATPRWILLALSLPAADEPWLASFAEALRCECDRYNVALVGGDTTRGPLSVTFTVLGCAATGPGSSLLRSGAGAGDELWVSGSLGAASAWLATVNSSGENSQLANLPEDAHTALGHAYFEPEPRLVLGQSLLGVATAAIDISDGLLADAGHLATASGVSLQIEAGSLPIDTHLQAYRGESWLQRCVLAGGDDYELLFTAPGARHSAIEQLAQDLGTPVTCIGKAVSPRAGGSRVHLHGWPTPSAQGYRHF